MKYPYFYLVQNVNTVATSGFSFLLKLLTDSSSVCQGGSAGEANIWLGAKSLTCKSHRRPLWHHNMSEKQSRQRRKRRTRLVGGWLGESMRHNSKTEPRLWEIERKELFEKLLITWQQKSQLITTRPSVSFEVLIVPSWQIQHKHLPHLVILHRTEQLLLFSAALTGDWPRWPMAAKQEKKQKRSSEKSATMWQNVYRNVEVNTPQLGQLPLRKVNCCSFFFFWKADLQKEKIPTKIRTWSEIMSQTDFQDGESELCHHRVEEFNLEVDGNAQVKFDAWCELSHPAGLVRFFCRFFLRFLYLEWSDQVRSGQTCFSLSLDSDSNNEFQEVEIPLLRQSQKWKGSVTLWCRKGHRYLSRVCDRAPQAGMCFALLICPPSKHMKGPTMCWSILLKNAVNRGLTNAVSLCLGDHKNNLGLWWRTDFTPVLQHHQQHQNLHSAAPFIHPSSPPQDPFHFIYQSPANKIIHSHTNDRLLSLVHF